MRVYISGKITGTDDYMERFERAEQHLMEQSQTPINPARVCAELPNYLDYTDYMKVAFALLDISDSIYMLDGWAESKGATAEHFYAQSMGKDILYENEGSEAQKPNLKQEKPEEKLDYGKNTRFI